MKIFRNVILVFIKYVIGAFNDCLTVNQEDEAFKMWLESELKWEEIFKVVNNRAYDIPDMLDRYVSNDILCIFNLSYSSLLTSPNKTLR